MGSGTPRTVGQLASALASAYGGPSPVVTGEYRLGDVRHITASSDRIRRELGWRATVPFTDGVAEFAAVPAGRGPAGQGPAGRVPADGRAIQELAGSLISKQQPAPVFTTRTLPWWASMTPRTIARPRPAPLPGAGLRASVPRQARSNT